MRTELIATGTIAGAITLLRSLARSFVDCRLRHSSPDLAHSGAPSDSKSGISRLTPGMLERVENLAGAVQPGWPKLEGSPARKTERSAMYSAQKAFFRCHHYTPNFCEWEVDLTRIFGSRIAVERSISFDQNSGFDKEKLSVCRAFP